MPRKKKAKLPQNISVESLIDQGLCILQEEILKIKDNKNSELRDRAAMSLLNDYLRTAVQLKREERQAMVEAELSNLEDGNLNDLAKQALLYLKHTDIKAGHNE